MRDSPPGVITRGGVLAVSALSAQTDQLGTPRDELAQTFIRRTNGRVSGLSLNTTTVKSALPRVYELDRVRYIGLLLSVIRGI